MMEYVDWGMFILLLGVLAMILMLIALCIGDDDVTVLASGHTLGDEREWREEHR
ncbi:MAG TPA: hypothetical protein VD997_12290 [Phycisphaerales bacterium]|nr:hypothetical protein [Phycisphaerales bacterium]